MHGSRLRAFLLLLLGATVPLLGNDGTSPVSAPGSPTELLGALMKACDDNDPKRAQALIAQGAPVDEPFGPNRLTPLLEASRTSSLIVAILIGQKVRLNDTDPQGNTPLSRACYFKQTDAALTLLTAGADPNISDHAGRTSLAYATMKGEDVVIKALVAHHADLSAYLPGDNPPLWWAVRKDRIDLAQLLLDLGADPKGPINESPILGEAARHHNISMIRMLLDHGADVNQIASGETTALQCAAQSGTTEIVHLLLEKGADPNRADQHGDTPLMLAANHALSPALEDLIDHGAKLDLKDKDGNTALILSCWASSEACVHVLVEHGADVNATNLKGETALLWAGDMGAVNIVDYLKHQGAIGTEPRILAKDTPAHPLSAKHRWALAVAAVYVQVCGYNPHVLGWDGYSQDGARKGLADVWNITDKAGLLAQLKDLVPPTRNLTELNDAARLANTNGIEFKIMVALMPSRAATEAETIRRIYPKWNEKFGLAGDLCRAANLINTGYQAGYLTEDECWPMLMNIARQAQANFTSWQELSDNFLDSREVWSGSRDPQFEACARLLLNPKDPNSPWNQNPWKTDLSSP